MKKAALYSIITLVIVLITVPPTIGFFLEKNYNILISSLQRSNIKIKTNFKIGYFTSTANTKFYLENFGAINLHHDIKQVPINFKLATITTNVTFNDLTPNAEKLLAKIFKDKTLLKMQTNFNFNGTGITNIYNNMLLSDNIHSNFRIESSGFKGTIHHKNLIHNNKINIILPKLDFIEQENKLSVSNFGINGELRLDSNYYLSGMLKNSFEKAVLTHQNNIISDINKFNIINKFTRNQANKQFYNIDFKISIDNLSIPKGVYGPGNIELNFINFSDDLLNKNDLNNYFAIAQNFINYANMDPQINLSSNITFTEGLFDCSIKAKLEKIAEPSTPNLSAKEILLQMLNVTLKAKIPKAIIHELITEHVDKEILILKMKDNSLTTEDLNLEHNKRFLEKLNNYLNNKYFIDYDDNYYVTDIAIKSGSIDYNGKIEKLI